MGKYRSVFDIIGPVMIGPSSSHTAGAVSIGRIGHILAGGIPERAVIHYYESFGRTHKGHGTDYAIASGLLGLAPDDPKVPNALAIACGMGVDIEFIEEDGDSPIHHPNTAVLDMEKDGKAVSFWACSIGGGTIEVRRIRMDGYDMRPSGLLPMLFIEENHSRSDSDKALSTVEAMLGRGGHVMQKTIYPKIDGEGRRMIGFELEHPLSAAQQDEIDVLASRLIYLH
ncbi:serine dehydratase [Bifidobacterium indicum]|nr:serine dehydratase beta chain [Bifidobacterium indicum]PXY80602.1 serine dehydratase [Bifidobacterium indicum]